MRLAGRLFLRLAKGSRLELPSLRVPNCANDVVRSHDLNYEQQADALVMKLNKVKGIKIEEACDYE